jgi:hypothetical protein
METIIRRNNPRATFFSTDFTDFTGLFGNQNAQKRQRKIRRGFTQMHTAFVLPSLGVFVRIFARSELLRKLRPQSPGSVEAGLHL